MAIERMEECGQCGKTIYPESEEVIYCKKCKQYFCLDCSCLCYDKTIERVNKTFEPPPNKIKYYDQLSTRH